MGSLYEIFICALQVHEVTSGTCLKLQREKSVVFVGFN
jgi:hypothetical protein